MRGTVAKALRRAAASRTVGRPQRSELRRWWKGTFAHQRDTTRAVYQRLKRQFMRRQKA